LIAKVQAEKLIMKYFDFFRGGTTMKTFIAGMDIGFGQAKVCLKEGDLKPQTLCFPRIFAEATTNNWGLNNHCLYGIGGSQFYVGQEALSYQDSFIRRDYRDYVKDNTYWLCICKALVELGIFYNNDTVHIKRLILGLAPGHYSKANIKHMQGKALEGIEFACNNQIYRFSAENVKILPQGSGAFFSEMLTDSGLVKEIAGYKKLYGILDVGFRTTDFLIFENGQFIGEKEELSEDTGMRTVLEKLQSYIKAEYDKEELEFLEPVMKGEPFEFRGEEHDLKLVVAQLVSDHIHQRIEPEILKRWESRLNRMNKIIICGGGAYFFKGNIEFLTEYRKQILIPMEPEMSNAIGFCRYGVMQEHLQQFQTEKW
jgi:hypothetical protein